MKWIFLIAAQSVLTLNAMMNACERSPNICCYPKEDPCGPDLFKRYDQIFSGSAEFLYWSVAEGALDYALSMRHNAWGPSPSYAQGKFENATYGLDPGFRLGLLYFRATHYWEARWQYTRMTSRGSNHASKPGPTEEYLTGTWPQITTEPLSGAHSRIHLNYNVFDWLVSRVFFPNPHLRFRLLGGAFSAWMSQDWRFHYTDSVPNTTSVRNRWKFVGGGLKSGTIVDWYWTGELYLTAQGFLGLLMGSYNNRVRQNTTFQPTPTDDPSVPVRDTSYRDVRPVATAQMSLGPSYQKNLTYNRIEVFVGYEANLWWNVQEIYRSSAGTPSEAKETRINSSLLALYGLTTRLSVDF
ncbi:MAG: Lpg1974 family pore-forming outer membrane protein [Chlamydiales bacterium]